MGQVLAGKSAVPSSQIISSHGIDVGDAVAVEYGVGVGTIVPQGPVRYEVHRYSCSGSVSIVQANVL